MDDTGGQLSFLPAHNPDLTLLSTPLIKLSSFTLFEHAIPLLIHQGHSFYGEFLFAKHLFELLINAF